MGKSERVGFMVTNKCEFFGSAQYPQIYLIGMKVPKIGKTSLQYQLGMFPLKDSNEVIEANMSLGYYQNDVAFAELSNKFANEASCLGESIHVFVDPANNNRPAPFPDEWKTKLERLQ